MVRDVISALPWGGDPTFRKPRNVGHPLAERLIVTLASFHRALGSLFPRCTSLLLPSLFVHAEHEEPHDLRSCPEKAEVLQGRGTDGIRAADIGRSANLNIQIPTTHPRFEAGR